jgi:hypothetical protein
MFKKRRCTLSLGACARRAWRRTERGADIVSIAGGKRADGGGVEWRGIRGCLKRSKWTWFESSDGLIFDWPSDPSLFLCFSNIIRTSSSHHQSSITPRAPQYTVTHSIAPSTALHSSTMSDDGEERVTKPFKFVTGTSITPPAHTQWYHANFS